MVPRAPFFYHIWMGDTFIISGLREKRSSVAGRILELRGEAEQLETDLFHIDAVLRMYEVDPADITTKGRVPKRSAYFARNEITKRIYEALRTQETVSAVGIAAQAMRDKGMDPDADARMRTNFARFCQILRRPNGDRWVLLLRFRLSNG